MTGQAALDLRPRRPHQLEPVGRRQPRLHHDLLAAPSAASRGATGSGSGCTFFRRDSFQWESFYASPSTDGQRVFTVARSGTVLALSVRDGHTIWTNHLGALTYGTPSIAHGRVFVATLGGDLYAFRSTTGAQLWSKSRRPAACSARRSSPATSLFFSTLEGQDVRRRP